MSYARWHLFFSVSMCRHLALLSFTALLLFDISCHWWISLWIDRNYLWPKWILVDKRSVKTIIQIYQKDWDALNATKYSSKCSSSKVKILHYQTLRCCTLTFQHWAKKFDQMIKTLKEYKMSLNVLTLRGMLRSVKPKACKFTHQFSIFQVFQSEGQFSNVQHASDTKFRRKYPLIP